MNAPAENVSAAEIVRLPLKSLESDDKLVCRVDGLNADTVSDYARAIQAGAKFPPIVVFRDADSKHWVADGNHRRAAAELAGRVHIDAELHIGTWRDALMYGARSNEAHGLRRTNLDKRHAIALVLREYPDLSLRAIARAANVNHETVKSVRDEAFGDFATSKKAAKKPKRSSKKSSKKNAEKSLLAEIERVELRLTKYAAERDEPAVRNAVRNVRGSLAKIRLALTRPSKLKPLAEVES